jgi:hypothetical protein
MNRQIRHIVVPITIGIVVAATVLAGGWWLSQGGDERPAGSPPTATPSVSVSTPPDTGEPTPSTTAPQVGTWQRLPAAPIPGMSDAYLEGAWTGQELLVTGLVVEGGDDVTIRHLGAAYDPATGAWRTLPPMPGVVEHGEGHYRAVWTGRELLAWGPGLHAAYNPATNRWRSLSGRIGAPSVMVWTGRQVLTWGGGCCGEESAYGAAYTPATDSWAPLPRGPLAGRHTTGVWTGTEMVVIGGSAEVAVGGVVSERVFRDAAAYNPATRSWRRLPPMPEPRAGATATWTGTEVLVVGGGGSHGGYTDGVAYNPATNRWRRLPSMGVGRTGHTAVWTGDQLLVWGARTAPPYGLAYDPATNQWSELPISPLRGRTGHLAVWTGGQMLIWGGSSARASDPDTLFADGAAYTPRGS